MTYSKLDDPDYLCVQIVELTAEVERLTAENERLFDRANDVMAENQRLRRFAETAVNYYPHLEMALPEELR